MSGEYDGFKQLEQEPKTFSRRTILRLVGGGALAVTAFSPEGFEALRSKNDDTPPVCKSLHNSEFNSSPLYGSDGSEDQAFEDDLPTCPAATPVTENTPELDSLTQR